jgi:hypothetical protein
VLLIVRLRVQLLCSCFCLSCPCHRSISIVWLFPLQCSGVITNVEVCIVYTLLLSMCLYNNVSLPFCFLCVCVFVVVLPAWYTLCVRSPIVFAAVGWKASETYVSALRVLESHGVLIVKSTTNGERTFPRGRCIITVGFVRLDSKLHGVRHLKLVFPWDLMLYYWRSYILYEVLHNYSGFCMLRFKAPWFSASQPCISMRFDALKLKLPYFVWGIA